MRGIFLANFGFLGSECWSVVGGRFLDVVWVPMRGIGPEDCLTLSLMTPDGFEVNAEFWIESSLATFFGGCKDVSTGFWFSSVPGAGAFV